MYEGKHLEFSPDLNYYFFSNFRGAIEEIMDKYVPHPVQVIGSVTITLCTTGNNQSTEIGRGVELHDGVVIGPGVTLGDNVHILPNAHLETEAIVLTNACVRRGERVPRRHTIHAGYRSVS